MASPKNKSPEAAKLGIALMVIAMFAFAISDAFVKVAGDTIFIGQIIFYIGLICAFVLAIIVVATKQKLFSRHYLSRAIMLRGISEVGVAYFLFLAFFMGTYTKTIAIHQFQPVLVTLGAIFVFNEKVGWRRWSAILLAFASVLLILRPGFAVWDQSASYALIAVLCLAVRDLATKSITDALSAYQISFVCVLPLIPAGFLLMIINGEPFYPGAQNMLYVTGAALFAVIAYITITISMRLAQFATVMPFRYTRTPIALVIGVAFFGDKLDWQTIVGMVGILIAGVFIIVRADRA